MKIEKSKRFSAPHATAPGLTLIMRGTIYKSKRFCAPHLTVLEIKKREILKPDTIKPFCAPHVTEREIIPRKVCRQAERTGIRGTDILKGQPGHGRLALPKFLPGVVHIVNICNQKTPWQI